MKNLIENYNGPFEIVECKIEIKNTDSKEFLSKSEDIYIKSETIFSDDLLKKAFELYEKSKTIDCTSIDPLTWLKNQDQLKKAWEMFTDKPINNGIFKSVFMENDFSLYMKFMYDSFPTGIYEVNLKNITQKVNNKNLTAYERNKIWREKNPEKYKEQTKRKYLARKERKLKESQQLEESKN